MDVHNNNAIRAQCASLANSIEKNLSEHMKTYSKHHYNLQEAFQYGTTRHTLHKKLYFTVFVHVNKLTAIMENHLGTPMPAKDTRKAMSFHGYLP